MNQGHTSKTPSAAAASEKYVQNYGRAASDHNLSVLKIS
jgi:hypothetical protein